MRTSGRLVLLLHPVGHRAYRRVNVEARMQEAWKDLNRFGPANPYENQPVNS